MGRKLSSFLIMGGIALVFIIIMGSSTFKTLDPGEKGIMFRKFSSGLDKRNLLDAGFHVIAPWNDMIVYNVKEQSRDENMDILDKNGLSLHVDVTIRFNPNFAQIGDLHEKFGKNYIEQLVIPELRAAVRNVMGLHSAEEIYSLKRKEVETEIVAITTKSLAINYIDMRALLIRSIVLPAQIKQAIENKLQQEQEALAYQFRLDKEKSEAERKRIEAEGVSNANKIINSSLTNELLKMRGIEATLQLAQSQNSKVVVIGGKDGMPLILGNDR